MNYGRLIILFLLLFSTRLYSQTIPYLNYNVEQGLPSPQVYDIFEDDMSYLWFATDRGMVRFNGDKFESFSKRKGLETLTNFRVFSNSSDTFWINSIVGTINYWADEHFHSFKHNDKLLELVDGVNKWIIISEIKNNEISFFIQGNNLNVCPKFLYKININTGVIKKYSFDKIKTDKNTPYLTKMFLGNFNIYGSREDSVKFEKLKNYEEKVESPTISIFDSKDNVLVGSWHGLYIYLHELKDAEPIHLFKNASITSILQAKSGGYWISTLGKGIYYIPNLSVKKVKIGNEFYRNEMFKRIEVSDSLINFISDKSVICTINGKMDIKMSSLKQKKDDIFNRIELSNGKELVYNTGVFYINENNCRKYYERALCAIETMGNVYVGTAKHLYRADLSRNDEFNIIDLPFDESLIRVSKLVTDSIGLWIATMNNGLLYKKKNKYYKIRKNLLLSNIVHSIYLENDSTLYVATNNGLNILSYRITDDGIEIDRVQSYNSSFGLPSDYILDIKKWNNHIWVSTSQGICYFTKDALNKKNDFPNFFIKGIFGNGRKAIKNKFSSDINSIRILFEAPSMIHLPSNRYKFRYRLNHGIWFYTQNNYMDFNELSSGKYLFEIECGNLNGDWSKTKKDVFSIAEKFYEKSGFIFGIFFLTIFLIWIIMKKRERTLINKTTKEMMYKEIELSTLRNQINPHLTFNSLNMIQSHLFSNNPEKANQHLGNLSQVIRKGLELSRQKTIRIRDEIAFIESYLNLEKERFENRFSYSIDILDELKLSKIELPPLLTQPFVENAIKHAFSNRIRNGQISLKYTLENFYLRIVISDNGRGFDVNQKFNNTSLGFELVNRMLYVLNKGKKEKGNLKIESIIGKGTTIILQIPIKNQV